MKLSLNKFSKSAFVLVVGSVALLGIATLFANRAQASVGGPQCGPTILWSCTLPDGTVVPFGGTYCQMIAYEKKTGAHCTAGG